MQKAHTADAEAAVRDAAERYAAALWTSDAETLRAIFHPVANLYGRAEDGSLDTFDREVWLGRVAAREPGQGDAPVDVTSVSVDASDMAHATVECAISTGLRFTDYLNFLHLDGEWRVISKIFHAHR